MRKKICFACGAKSVVEKTEGMQIFVKNAAIP